MEQRPLCGTRTRLARVILISVFCALQCRRVAGSGGFRGQVEDSRSSADGKEVWGYSRVAPGSHMFWWLYYSTHPSGRYARPLVIWLQGGPGLSSSGVGNLALLGPMDENMRPRNHTWVKEANILFVDNPVDTGYSYLDNGSNPANNAMEIAWDLINMLESVMDLLPDLRKLPVYIFGQSYGGKMAAVLGYELKKAIIWNNTDINFKGVAFGNAWISPVDSVLNWAPLMLHMSVIDQYQYENVDGAARALAREIETCGPYCSSSNQKWNALLNSAPTVAVNYYNLREYNTQAYYDNEMIPKHMNGTIRQKLGIIPDHVKWQNPSMLVHSTATKNDFLVPEIDKVDWLLDRGVEVVIYQGQLDIMCPTNGAQDWINKLKWRHFRTFYDTTRVPLMAPGENTPEMFVKAHKNLKFYYVLKSGHAVPRNTPAAALRMLGYILGNEHTGAAKYQSSHSDVISSSFSLLIVQLIFTVILTLTS